MPLPQDIRPVFQDIQDTLVRSDAPWIEQSPMSKVKVLWVGRETGTWASLHHWKKGYVAPPHKHLAGAHAYVLSGKLQVRDGVLNAGDYVYEPSGVLHDETTALEDTTYLFICNGAVLFFDENGFTRYTNGKSWKSCARRPKRRHRAPRRRSSLRLCPGAVRTDRDRRSAGRRARRSNTTRAIRAPRSGDYGSRSENTICTRPQATTEPAAQAEPAEIRDRLAPPDDRHAADVAIPEWPAVRQRPRAGLRPRARHRPPAASQRSRPPAADRRGPLHAAVSPMTKLPRDGRAASASGPTIDATGCGRIRRRATERHRMRPRPAAQIKVRLSILSSPSTAPSASQLVTGCPSRTSTPRRASEWAAMAASAGGKLGSTPRPGLDEHDAGRGRIDVAEIVAPGPPAQVRPCEPASSTPVGPPPMMTKVSSRRRSASSVASSARSKASSTRLRIAVASSIVFRPGATASHSSWPK